MKTPLYSEKQLDQIRRESAERAKCEPAIEAAHLEAGRLVLEMRGGAHLRVPISSLPALESAGEAEVGAMRLVSDGNAIHWPALDVQMSTIAILEVALGLRSLASHAAKAGSVRTPAKSLAARANGAKGGRPRKASVTGHSR